MTSRGGFYEKYLCDDQAGIPAVHISGRVVEDGTIFTVEDLTCQFYIEFVNDWREIKLKESEVVRLEEELIARYLSENRATVFSSMLDQQLLITNRILEICGVK